MVSFPPAEVTFTLLDIHPESVACVESIVHALGLAEHVASIETADAGSYRICPNQAPDIILMEIMLACLEAEPQVAITRHLLAQAPDAILVPEEVRIDLVLVDQSREFDVGGSARNDGISQRDRNEVGSVFVVNRETVESWRGNHRNRLPASSLRFPDSMEPKYQPMLRTAIRVYQNHVLKDYDSGLTCPRSVPIEDAVKPGDTIQFHYELGSHPRLVGEVHSPP